MNTPHAARGGLPAKHEVHVVAFALRATPTEIAECEQWLSPDERARADRFLVPDVRRRFVVCRGRLRQQLAQACAVNPRDVAFEYGQWGKPVLTHPKLAGLHFNISHSQDWALCALARSPLGIDLEIPGQPFQPRTIASQILSSREQSDYEKLPANLRDTSILRLWVCKEALLKAMGLGIAEGLRQVSFPLPLPAGRFAPLSIDAALQIHLEDDGTCRMNHWIDAQSWRLELLDVSPLGAAAICYQPSIQRITLDCPPSLE